MKRCKLSKLSFAVATLVAGVAACVWRQPPEPGRRMLLAEGGGAGSGVTRFFSQVVELADDTTQSWVTVTRTGTFTDPRYGTFAITPTHLAQMVANFNARVLGQDVFIDVAHRPDDGAAAKVLRLSVENGRLRALVEWTAFGLQAVKARGFVYLSAEYHENWIDNEKQQPHGCVLLGAGLTTRPVIKNLEPVRLSLDGLDANRDGVRVGIAPQLLKQLTENTVDFLEQLRVKYLAMNLGADLITKLLALAKAQLDAAGTDAVKCLALVDTWATTGQTVADQLRTLGAGGGGAGGAGGAGGGQPIQITLAQPAPVDVAAELTRLLAQRDAAAAQGAATLAAKVKLLSDTIAAGDATIKPDDVKALAAEVQPLVTAGMTDDQVKVLATHVVQNHQRVTAAARLAGMGYVPIGNARIEVMPPDSGKALQEEVDKRLSFADRLPIERYWGTGGQLLAVNKKMAEKVLAQFDKENGARLFAEQRSLAAGPTGVADVAVPAIVERTVIREVLYNLSSLNYMDVGSAAFADVLRINYDYRDISAAGVNALRRYEGQPVLRAGMIQRYEETRPIPQKLAYSLSAEVKMLLSGSLVDYDPATRSMENLVRIVGEDTEMLNSNELVCSADEFGATTITDTLTAQVNGTNKVFVLTQFPVVRPRKVFDLRGTQVGSTTNPITVTLNSVARNEYVLNADGTALAAGTYWVMDYNLGELRFVNEAGAPVTPTSAWVLTVAYSYSTNAVKWDTDAVNGEDIKDRYDRLLVTLGSRKAVISGSRYYTPNMVLMSPSVDNAVSQARSFEANASRVATGLAADGSVGQIKAMPTFNTTAPNLMLGDTRILLGQRGQSRFRMLKPWSMKPPEQMRDANGRFTDGEEAFGTQWVAVHTPTPLKNALTSVILYSSSGRVARAA